MNDVVDVVRREEEVVEAIEAVDLVVSVAF